jgi:adenine deaminase
LKTISGNIVDVVNKTITKGILKYENGIIKSIEPAEIVEDQFIVPGLVDAHIHIESSMMLPAEFARYSVIHGTVACVCDPHEMANVCGIPGIDYMIENGKQSPMKFFFGAPSCVPSTLFETSGAILDADDVTKLLKRDDIYFLAEMMNFPGVIHKNKQVYAKLDAARRVSKPIDGHAPELSGEDLEKYAAAGITTDHECSTIAEAEAKIALGMKIQIREGSAAKNFDALIPLIENFPDEIMFCSDDKHPDDLIKNGHIDSLIRRAMARGFNSMDVLRACSYVPVKHYKLNVGLLQTGDPADFAIVNNLTEFAVKATYIQGEKVSENNKPLFPRFIPQNLINQFNAKKITADYLKITASGLKLKVIQVEDGQLFTRIGLVDPKIENGNTISDTENDILKLVVLNRYQPSYPTIAFIQNFGLKRGAIASTVAHDSHNIIAVGTSDAEITSAINLLIENKGGILAIENNNVSLLQLPVGGLMSELTGAEIAENYEKVDAKAKELGSTLSAPFMTLAFMSLLVIPEIKLGDRGLFDGLKFEFMQLME